MPILGLDTSGRLQSVAVCDGGKVLAQASLGGAARASDTLVPCIRMVLNSAGVAPSRLDGIAVACGPGRFTGLRVGLATAKGLALGTDIPVRGFSTLQTLAEALAAGVQEGSSFPVGALLDAGRGQVYSGLFRARRDMDRVWMTEAVRAEMLALPEEAVRDFPAGTLVGGEGALSHRARLEAAMPEGMRFADSTPELAPILAARADNLLSAGKFRDLPPLAPSYIRPPDALASRMP